MSRFDLKLFLSLNLQFKTRRIHFLVCTLCNFLSSLFFSFKEQKFDGQMFQGLVSLTKLVFCLTGLQALRQETFKFLSGLEWLVLKFSCIKSIEPGFFHCLQNLKRLDARGFYKSVLCPRLVELNNLEILNMRFFENKSVDELFDGMASDAVNTKLRVLNHHTNK
jgi:hypothetical protein